MFFVVLQLLIKDKPEFPPSAVAASPPSEQTLFESFGDIWANKNFIFLSISLALTIGMSFAFEANMSTLLNPFGYTASQIGFVGAILFAFGIPAALITGYFLDRNSSYRKSHITLTFFGLISVIAAVCVLAEKEADMLWITIVAVFLGIALVSLNPVCLSYGAELTFPMSPVVVNAFMNFWNKVIALIMIGTTALITNLDVTEENIESAEAI